jgi:hypothetical protein
MIVLENKYEENPSVQIEKNSNLGNDNKKNNEWKFEKIARSKESWKPHGITSLC